MEKAKLVETLQELHAALSGAKQVDPDTRALMRTLTDDIARLLEKEGGASHEEVEPVSSGLRDLVLRFEGDHPQLSLAVGKVADALSAMGI